MHTILLHIKRNDPGCECFTGTILEVVVRVKEHSDIKEIIQHMVDSNKYTTTGKRIGPENFTIDVLGYSDQDADLGIIITKQV